MGTRADFYVGRGKTARWLGSVGYDGYPDGIPSAVRKATSGARFRTAVAKFLAKTNSATLPDQGWPWPWEDSSTTDYAYAYHRGHAWLSCFGRRWFRADLPPGDDGFCVGDKVAAFPDMAGLAKREHLGAESSGVMVFRVRS